MFANWIITEVLAVPGDPTKRVCYCPGSFLISDLVVGNEEIILMMYSALVESVVGIRS